MENKKGLQNLYEVRKTVRFELIPEFIGTNKIPNGVSNNKQISIFNNLEKLVNLHTEFVNLFGKTLINENEEIIKGEKNSKGNIKIPTEILKNFGIDDTINNNLEESKIKDYFKNYEVGSLVQFKYLWLEKCFKNNWIENKKDITLQKENNGSFKKDKNGKYKKKNKNYITLTDLGENNFVKNFLIDWLRNNQEINKKLDSFKFIKNDLSRISDIGFEVQKLNSRNYLGKLYILFEGGYLNHKNNINIINDLKETLSQIKTLIQTLLELTKPSQSFGFPIEHISLNYYTRNKTPKEYNDEIEEKRKFLTKPYKGNLGELYGIDKNQSIEKLYEQMKIFKAIEKSAFMQKLQQNTKYENIGSAFEYIDFEGNKHENYKIQLFMNIKEGEDRKTKEKLNKEAVYKKVLDLTNRIEKETNKEEKTKLKIKRGNHFMGNWSSFPDYTNFCDGYENQMNGRKQKFDGYKQVAMEYGKRKSEVLMLEREKILAEKERGWGFITKNENLEYFINTIPIENTEKAYNSLRDGKLEVKNGNISYFIFSSITLRAFAKLCFKKDSFFAKQVKLKINSKFIKEIKNIDGILRKEIKSKKQLEEENLLISFYNEVLEKQNTLEILYRDGENSRNILKNSIDEEDFEINLKLECYVLNEYKTSEEKFKKVLEDNKGNSYKITSWDLRKERKKPEKHTKWWIDFWNSKNEENKFPLRINPEITISYVEQNKNFIKEKPNQTNNRRAKERYLLTTTLSHNADSKYIENSFIGDKKEDSIKQFNEKYNQDNNLQYFYGLDKGTNELITLGVYKKGINNKIEGVNLSKKIDIYKITNDGLNKTKNITNKDGNIKTHILYKNPSRFLEFINDNNIFEKQNIISCLGNLTSAKIIDGKIILNGDVNTIKKLYETNAKRFIYMLIQEQGSKDEKVIFDEKNQVFKFNNKKIYYYNGNVKIFISKDKIEKILNNYISQIKNFDSKKDELEDISINKINHLKSAVCANIVGVIMKLQEYFNGYIIFESLKVSTNNSDIEKQNTFLGNLINEKIYNKLQLSNEIPPILKQFRSDLDEKNIIQHGKIIYVNKNFTSNACPVCNESLTNISNDKKNEEIFKLFGHLTEFENSMHHYEESNGIDYGNNLKEAKKTKNNNCKYHMINNHLGFDFIKSGDDLATYNIAKKGLEYLNSLNNQF